MVYSEFIHISSSSCHEVYILAFSLNCLISNFLKIYFHVFDLPLGFGCIIIGLIILLYSPITKVDLYV